MASTSKSEPVSGSVPGSVPAPDTHPTLSESATRLWNSLPLLWKMLLPAVGALLIVLLPANLYISQRFFGITTDNLRSQHRAYLADLGNTFDEFINRYSLFLLTLANDDRVKACAANGCTNEAQAIFGG